MGFQKEGKQWRKLSLKSDPKSFSDIVKVYYTNSVLTFFQPNDLLSFSNIGWRNLNVECLSLPHSQCLFLGPFPCQLSKNLVCYACLPPRIQWILPQWPESSTQLASGQFQPGHEQVSPMSEHCLLHQCYLPNSYYTETDKYGRKCLWI